MALQGTVTKAHTQPPGDGGVCCTHPGVRPLLTNPTRCEGAAPETTLRADTYEDPADYVSNECLQRHELGKWRAELRANPS